MPVVSVNIPEKMKQRLEELSQEGMYQNESEYIRAALRSKMESDTGLTPEEEQEVLKRIQEWEKGEADTVPLEDVE